MLVDRIFKLHSRAVSLLQRRSSHDAQQRDLPDSGHPALSGTRGKFGGHFLCLVTVTSIMSDAVFREGSRFNNFTTSVDRVVASSALFVVLRFTMKVRPLLHHKLIALTGVAISIHFLFQGQRYSELSNYYRLNHMTWHVCLVATGMWSVSYRPVALTERANKYDDMQSF